MQLISNCNSYILRIISGHHNNFISDIPFIKGVVYFFSKILGCMRRNNLLCFQAVMMHLPVIANIMSRKGDITTIMTPSPRVCSKKNKFTFIKLLLNTLFHFIIFDRNYHPDKLCAEILGLRCAAIGEKLGYQ